MKVKNGKSASVEDGAVAINTDPPPPKPKGAPRSCRPQSFAHSQSSGVTIFDNKIETRAVTIKTTALTTIPKLRIPTLSPFMHRHKDEHKCWKSIAVKAIFFVNFQIQRQLQIQIQIQKLKTPHPNGCHHPKLQGGRCRRPAIGRDQANQRKIVKISTFWGRSKN